MVVISKSLLETDPLQLRKLAWVRSCPERHGAELVSPQELAESVVGTPECDLASPGDQGVVPNPLQSTALDRAWGQELSHLAALVLTKAGGTSG
jgi:hypothetical protein